MIELRKQIHEELRTQHPEWIEPTGESPKCDEYEVRLMKLLDSFKAGGNPGRPHATE